VQNGVIKYNSVKHFKQSITREFFLICSGVIQYHSVKHFKQSITQSREGGRLSGVHLVIYQEVCWKFQTCNLGSEPLLNTELPIEYARFQAASICETHCLHTHIGYKRWDYIKVKMLNGSAQWCLLHTSTIQQLQYFEITASQTFAWIQDIKNTRCKHKDIPITFVKNWRVGVLWERKYNVK